MNINQVIKKPLITEKAMALAKEGKYTFIVDIKADKKKVKQALGVLFGVQAIKVNLLKYKGKKKRAFRMRKLIKKSDYKKAIVQLKEGQKIEFFEEISGKKKDKSRRKGRGSSSGRK